MGKSTKITEPDGHAVIHGIETAGNVLRTLSRLRKSKKSHEQAAAAAREALKQHENAIADLDSKIKAESKNVGIIAQIAEAAADLAAQTNACLETV